MCERETVRKEVYLDGGVPVFVSSNQPDELLGEKLVEEGVLTREELDLALTVMPRFEGKLGETLVACGVVDPVRLFQHIARQVREKLLDLFLWESGRASFYDDVGAPDAEFPLHLDPWGMLDAGITRRIDAGLETERLDRLAGAPFVRVDQVGRPDALPPDFRVIWDLLLAPAELRVLSAVTDEGHLHRALVLFDVLGWLRTA